MQILRVKQHCLENGGMVVKSHPPHLPNPVTAQPFLFPTVKTALKTFQDVKDIKDTITSKSNAVLLEVFNDHLVQLFETCKQATFPLL
jgi:hypothetical protein